MHRSLFFSGFAAAAVLLVGAARAQTAGAGEVTFRSGVSNVRIDAQVVQDNQPVNGLTVQDFIVSDDGKPQPIVYFGREAEPLSLVLLLDVSGSMKKYIEQVGSVAKQSLGFLRSGDRVAVMAFARRSAVRLDFTDDMGAVANQIRDAVNDDTLGAGTALNEALTAAASYLEEKSGERGRRAILIVTDNLGLNYKLPDESVLHALGSANSVLNSLVVGRADRPPSPMPGGVYTNPDFTPFDVFRISDESGGESVRADKAAAAFPGMIERIRTRYSLHYNKPESATSGYRAISVSLTPSARLRFPRAVVRARKGYQVKS